MKESSIEKPRTKATLKQAWALTKRVYFPVLITTLIPALFGSLILKESLYFSSIPIPLVILGVVLLCVVMSFGTTLGFVFIASVHHQDKPCSWKLALRYAARSFGRVFVGSIIAVVIIGLGFLVFILPGIVLSIFLSIFFPILIFEPKKNILVAFQESFKRVKPYFWYALRTLLSAILLTRIIVFLLKGVVYLIGLSSAFSPDALGFLKAAVDFIDAALLAPFISAVFMAVYFELTKRAKERAKG